MGEPEGAHIYTADGTKIEKIVTDTAQGSLTATEYCGNYIYERTGSSSADLKFFSHPEGYTEPDGAGGYDYIYQYKDHLGNIRLSYSDDNGDGSVTTSEIREENNYYPFGLKHKGYNNNQNGRDHNYGFGGEEEAAELDKNTIDYQWRDYDPTIARFNKIDRFAEKYQSLNPYQFSANNPIFFKEIAGDSINVANLKRYNQTGLTALENDLESITGLDLKSDTGNLEYETEKGFLGFKRAKVSRDKNGKKIGSSKARRRLKRAIKNKKTVKVRNNPYGGSGVPINKRSILRLDFIQLNSLPDILSSDLNPKTFGLGLSFMHELDHSVVGKAIGDESSNPKMKPGPTVRRINQIRRQLGPSYGQRSAYDSTEIGNAQYIPWSRRSRRLIRKGIAPTMEYLKF